MKLKFFIIAFSTAGFLMQPCQAVDLTSKPPSGVAAEQKVDIIQNLIKNPSFENSLSDWKVLAIKGKLACSASTDQQFGGRRALEVKVPNSGDRTAVSQKCAILPSKTYSLSYHFLSGSTNNKDNGCLSVRVALSDANDKFISYQANSKMADTANLWVDSSSVFEAPANAAFATVEFNFWGPLGGLCYIDVIEVKAVSDEGMTFNSVYPDNTPVFDQLTERTKDLKVYPIWTYTSSPEFVNKALALGTEYSLEAKIAELSKHNLAPFQNFDGVEPGLAAKYQTPILFYPNSNKPWEKAIKNGALASYNATVCNSNEPAYIKVICDAIDAAKFDSKTPLIYFISDEWYNTSNCGLAPLDKRSGNEFWSQMEGIVKEKYGFGKYGVPADAKDSDPFKRIAYLRHQADVTVDTIAVLSDKFRTKFPHGKVLGTDEWSAPTPTDFERLGKSVDIQPGQALNSASGVRGYANSLMPKFLHDLSGKPCYPFLQVVLYPAGLSPKTFHNWINQAFQSGADGIFVGTVEWYDRAMGDMSFAAPNNWQAFLSYIKETQNLRIKRPTDKNMALHFGSYTQMTRWKSASNNLFGAHGMLGPRARTWFTITDDFQIDRNANLFDAYKSVVICDSQYISETMQKALLQFVERGGTLIVTDPAAFTWRIDGTKLDDFREKLLGVKTANTANSHYKITVKAKELPISDSDSQQLTILNPQETLVMGSYADGTPAIVEHQLGKGKVWYFGFNPFNDMSIDSTDWTRQFRKWLTENWNSKIDYDIWRFELPFYQAPKDIFDEFVCWTGNDLNYVSNYPNVSRNASPVAKSNYQYLIAPAEIADMAAQDGKIEFNAGRLTNRLAWLKLKKDSHGKLVDKNDQDQKNWVVMFGEKETQANAIVFDLIEKRDLQYIRISFAGVLPELTIYSSNDNQTWQEAGHQDSFDAKNGVKLLSVKLNSSASRYLKIAWQERMPAKFTIGEVDIWGKK